MMTFAGSAELLAATVRTLAEAPSARSVLALFPRLLQTHLPLLAQPILYYREPEGNLFKGFSAEPLARALPPLKESGALLESFNGRRDFLLENEKNRIHFRLYNDDSGGLLQQLGLNLLIPLHARRYFRGLLLARLAADQEHHAPALAAAVQTAAQPLIALNEAENLELDNDKNYYKLFKFDRLVLLGQMAASLAHELRTPLATVLFEISAMADLLPQNPEIAAARLTIHREIARANDLIESLLVFSKFKELRLEPVELAAFAAECLRDIPGRKIPSGVRLSLEAGEAITVLSDRNRLRQVFFNVLFNALEAVGERGEITVRVFSQYRDSPAQRSHRIAIEDNGPGIPDQLKEKVLEPFFTTKKEGTGLGLYISYGIMKSLKGDLDIQSSAAGTRVSLILPERKSG